MLKKDLNSETSSIQEGEKNIDSNLIANIPKKPFVSFNNAVIIGLIFLFSYILILFLLRNEQSLKVIFSDLFSPIVEILVVFLLFYASKISIIQGKHVKTAWLILSVAVLFYAIGDILWAILELIIQQNPFPSVADFFYLLFYPLFALGIYYFPRSPLSRNEKLKLIIDVTIIITTVSLILGTFLIVPLIFSSQDILGSIISIFYVIGDVILLFAVIHIIFNNFKNIDRSPLILLGMSITAQVITDTIYSYQSIQGTYVSGGLLDAGWVLSMILIGLAAILEINQVINKQEYFKLSLKTTEFSFSFHIPLLAVAIAYILLIWSYYNLNSQITIYIIVGVGLTILLVLLRQAITLYENKMLYMAAKKEISNRKIVENALKENQRSLETLISNLPGVVYKCMNDPNWTMEFVSEGCLELTGYPAEDIVMNKKISYEEVIHPDDRQMVWDTVQKALKENKPFKMMYRITTADSKNKYVWEQGRGIFSEEGDLISLEGFITDISERKKSEKQIKKSLEEKELLLKEIHHRVKNNMQIIRSLLSIQSSYIEDQNAIEAFDESEMRIMSMSLVHESLYLSENLSNIDIENYIKKLVETLIITYDGQKINIKYNIENIKLNIETAIPCGLIINELVTNSIKHAFPADYICGPANKKFSDFSKMHYPEFQINIEFTQKQDELILIISDNGVGLPEQILKGKNDHLGLKLVEMLVNQLSGTLKIDNDNGTTLNIIFKELEYNNRF